MDKPLRIAPVPPAELNTLRQHLNNRLELIEELLIDTRLRLAALEARLGVDSEADAAERTSSGGETDA
jgi:hypothetical protein